VHKTLRIIHLIFSDFLSYLLQGIDNTIQQKRLFYGLVFYLCLRQNAFATMFSYYQIYIKLASIDSIYYIFLFFNIPI